MKKTLIPILSALVAVVCSDANALTYSVDLTKASVSDWRYYAGSTPGRIVSSSASSITFEGTTGPLNLTLPSVTSLVLNDTFPRSGTAPGPLPSNTSEYLGTSYGGGTRDITYDLRGVFADHPTNYREIVAGQLGIPLADVPIVSRLTFSYDVLGSVYFHKTDYSYTGGSSPFVNSTSFDATWNINDIPGTHRAVAHGFNGSFEIGSGHYDLPGQISLFTIENADNSGGPSQLTLSNFSWNGSGGSYPTIATDDYYQAIRFVAVAIPEPETYALMLGGLGVVAWARRRRS